MKILSSKNYAQFVSDPKNREVGKIGKLVASMEKYGFLAAYPIHCVMVCGKLVVKDGQHRLNAAQSLGIPVYYIILEDNKITVSEINAAQKAWSFKDFISSHSSEDYRVLREYAKRTEISLISCAGILSGCQPSSGTNKREHIRTGSFKVTPEGVKLGAVIERIITKARCLVKWAKHTEFVNAISMCIFVPEFDPDVLIHKIEANPGLLILQPTREAFLEMIEEVYNRNSRKKVNLKFLAVNAAKARNVIKPN